MAEDITLRVQLVDEVKPGTPSAPPAPITPPAPVPPPTSPVTQANSLAGIPQPEPVYQGVGFVAGPVRGADLPPPSSPERPSPGFRPGKDFNDFGINLSREATREDNARLPPIMPPGWRPPVDEDKLTDVIQGIRDQLNAVDDAVAHFHQTVQATDRTWESIPLPFTNDTITDEKDFNDFGINLSRPATAEDNARLPPVMPPGWRPPVDAEAVSQRELDQRNRAYHTPPPAPEPVQAPPINPTASRRAFGLAARERLGQAAASLGTQLPGIVGSSVGAGVGAATGSGTLGSVAGSAAGGLATLIPAITPVGIALGAVAVGAVGAVEALKKLRAITNELAQGLVGISGTVTAASARAEIQALQNKLYTAREVGPILAQNITAESELDKALNKFSTELVREFGPLINEGLEDLASIISLISDLKKAGDGWLGYLLEGPFGVGAIARIAKWWRKEKENETKIEPVDQRILDFLDPSKVNEIPRPRNQRRQQGGPGRPGGIF